MNTKKPAAARLIATLLTGALAAAAPAADRPAPERPAHAASAPVVSTLEEARACDLVDDALEDRRAAVDAEFRYNDQALADSQADGRRIEQVEKNLDDHSQRAIDDFNAQVARHNAAIEAINARADVARQMQADYNAALLDRNHRCGTMVLKDPDFQAWKKEHAVHAKARAVAAAAASAARAASAAEAAAAATAASAPTAPAAAPHVPPAPKNAGLQA
jgi:hypothetical protein